MFTLKNKAQIMGHLGSDPQIKMTESGKKIARFSVATNESYINAAGEKISATQWHQLVAWDKLADIVEKYLASGSHVLATGKIINRSYTDDDGIKRYASEIQLSEVLFLDDKPSVN